MIKKIIFGFLMCTLFICLTFNLSSCRYSLKNEDDEQKRLVSFLLKNNIPANANIILLQPSKCLSCQPAILKAVDSIEMAYILFSTNDTCMSVKPGHKCIPYDEESLYNSGLSQLYSELIVLQNGKIVSRKALFK